VREPRSSSSRWRSTPLDLLLAEHGSKVVERGAVRDPACEQPGDVVGHHRFGAIAAPALADLAQVLKDRETSTPCRATLGSSHGSSAISSVAITDER
jgi:hypothetical protein